MQTPVQISFRDVPPSPAVEAAVGKEVAELEKYCDRMIGCRVVISEPHRHQHKGRLYAVQIAMAVPGEELVVSHEHRLHPGHDDVYLAVREAFHAARRELEDYLRRTRRQVKQHAAPPTGSISRLFSGQDYGFIRCDDGREFYFHRNSLLQKDFDKLRPGDEVSFAEEAGEKGPVAKSVRVVRPVRSS